MPRRSPFVIELTKGERAELEAWVKEYTSPYRDVMRARIVLLASEGLGNDSIAARLSMPRQIVSKWRRVSIPSDFQAWTSSRVAADQPAFSPQRCGCDQGACL